MKLRKLTLIFYLCMIVSTVFSQGKIKELEIKEKGTKIKINFLPICESQNYEGLQIKITPISASDLNEMFQKESAFNGQLKYSTYDQSVESYFLKKGIRYRVKSDYEFLLEGIDWLKQHNKIDDTEYQKFHRMIDKKYSEKANEANNEKSSPKFNPYYVGNKYLNVFKLEIENKSHSYHYFEKEMSVESGGQLNSSLRNEQLISYHKMNETFTLDKAMMIEKYNLPHKMQIPPNSKVTKYFSVLPTGYNFSDIMISFEGLKKKFEWKIDKRSKVIENQYRFNEFLVNYGFDGIAGAPKQVFNILSEKPLSVYLDDDILYVNQSSLNKMVRVTTLALYFDRIYFKENEIIGVDYYNTAKNRRYPVILNLDKIEEIQIKEKQ